MRLPGLHILKRRPDFLAVAASGAYSAAPGLVLQAKRHDAGADPARIGVGFTVTRKVGNAVTRNRAKRRLRALAARMLPRHARFAHDYVLVARMTGTVERSFPDLQRDLEAALRKLRCWRDAGS